MKNTRVETLNAIIIICSTVFTILSAFTCYRTGTLFSGIHDPLLEGTVSWHDEINNSFDSMISIFLLEIFLMMISRRFLIRFTDLVISLTRIIRTFLTSISTLLYLVGADVFARMGGLGSGVSEVTIIGYMVFGLSWIILILHMKLQKEKRRLFEKDAYEE